MPIDHTAMNVTDIERSKAFYSDALKPLGYSLMFEVGEFLGYGDSQMPSLGIVRRDPAGGGHVALAAGGTDNGVPGLREHYHPTYYAAYVKDPDGNNIEAVTHRPE